MKFYWNGYTGLLDGIHSSMRSIHQIRQIFDGTGQEEWKISLAAFYTRGESGRWAGLFNTRSPFPRGGESLSKVQHLKEKKEKR
jgi:hypothetical protein